MSDGIGEPPSIDQESSATVRLHADFVTYLRDQRFHPGEQIGSERSLAQQFRVTRNQLRVVIDDLENRNVVQRRLGRNGGLFMADQLIQRHLNTILGVPEMVRRQGLLLRTVVLNVSSGLAYPDERRALALNEQDQVVRIERLRVVEGTPWSLDLSVLPSHRFVDIAAQELSSSLYELLHASYGVEIDWADETVSVAPTTAEQARLLDTAPGDSVLSIWRTTYEVSGRPFEFAHDLFRADRTRLQMQKFGTNWKRTVRRANDRTHDASRQVSS